MATLLSPFFFFASKKATLTTSPSFLSFFDWS
jgi:hypothetical protein